MHGAKYCVKKHQENIRTCRPAGRRDKIEMILERTFVSNQSKEVQCGLFRQESIQWLSKNIDRSINAKKLQETYNA